MNFLYHMVPDNLIGDKITSLKDLKAIDETIYDKQKEKYNDRKEIIQQIIPILECKWNDVIHLIAVPPMKIKNALKKAGFNPPLSKWFKINPFDIEKESAIIYRYTTDKLDKNEFRIYNPANLKQYTKLPKKTLEYYKKSKREGKLPLTFGYVPHILYRNSLGLDKMEIIEI